MDAKQAIKLSQDVQRVLKDLPGSPSVTFDDSDGNPTYTKNGFKVIIMLVADEPDFLLLKSTLSPKHDVVSAKLGRWNELTREAELLIKGFFHETQSVVGITHPQSRS
jgi:hypothetical protein